MAKATYQELSAKQLEILRFILKVRMAKIHNIISYLNPKLRGTERNNPDFERARKALSKTMVRLKDAGYIKQGRVDSTTEVYYYLTQDGQNEIYAHMGITEFDKNMRSGFNFELGHFPWRVPPIENIHSRFQTNMQTSILSLNRLVELDEDPSSWVFGGVKLKNICSIRDNLHSSPRNSKIHDREQYKPDGEILLNLSRYDDMGNLIDTNGELAYYFLEYDRKTEYGEKLDAKFRRLNLRLKELRENKNKHLLYKGMLVILENPKYDNGTGDLQSNLRYLKFLQSFRKMCKEFIHTFNIVVTTASDLESTLLSLRVEYSKEFANPLFESWRYKELQKTFLYSEPKTDGRVSDYFPSKGNMLGRFTKDQQHFCLFINIEGLNTLAWKKAIQTFTDLNAVAVGYTLYPVVVFRNVFSYPPELIDRTLLTKLPKEQALFFERLYMLDLRISRPILYKDLEAVDFTEAPFIVK